MGEPGYRVGPVTALELSGPLLEDALTVFGAALDFPRQHSRVRGMGESIRRHAMRAGFRALGAFETGRHRLVGFTYGYTSEPGLWWREQIAAGMTPQQRAFWLSAAFELAELHVEPAAQGQRLGSQLHDGLLRDLRERTALLSVMHRSDRARRLYTSRGWQSLIDDMRFSTDPGTPFSVLGLILPARKPAGPPIV